MGTNSAGRRDQRSFAALEARVGELERREQRARRVAGAALIVAAAVAVAGASPALSIPDVLAARRFHIVDERGAVVGRWVTASGGSMRLETLAGEEVTGVVEVTANARTPEKNAPATGGDEKNEEKKKDREPFDWLD